MSTSYYNKVKGHLFPGGIAESRDINLMQTNIGDMISAVINDLHEHTSFILGSDENAFLLSPAPKRLGRYIDTMNLVASENEEWLSIRRWGYRQRIKKGKSSLYSIICKFKNTSSNPITVWCELQTAEARTIQRSSIEIPANTESSEFEIIFDKDNLTTAPGLSDKQIEPFDTNYMAPPPKEESFEQGIDHTNEEDINNFTIGASEVYFVVEALNISETDIAINGDEYDVITDDSFAILGDSSGSYGKLLERKGGLDYTQIEYDLFFKDIYATGPTYLCEMGEAVINGERVKCMDTHISIAGANDYGNVNTFVYMDVDGHLRGINSDAFLDENKKIIKTNMPGAYLPIAIITTYMDDNKSPTIYQDDTSMVVRPRSHHERIRRLEKKTDYLTDISIPPRIKYTYSGKDIIDENPDGEVGKIDKGNYYLTTNAKGNVVIKNSQSEVINIPITLKSETEIKDATGLELSKRFAEIKDMDIDKEKGTLKLKTTQEKTTGVVGTTDKEAKETVFNPWDDDASNRPKNSDIQPTEREYSVTKGKNNSTDNVSEFPAMTFYTDKDYNLTGINIPITKFKNCESIKFIIWKRQGPNDKTNEVWFEKKIYTSESFSLANAKIKDDYQIVEDGFTIKIDQGLTLPKGQYVIVCFHSPKEGTGSCFVDTYKPDNPKDFCIRYYGAADGSHFLLKERYHEVWYNSALFKGTEAKLATEGYVVSGTTTWENEEPISIITPIANISTPEKCSYELYADTGGGYQKIELNKPNTMTGGGTSFKWKLVFKGDGDTPVLEYNEEKGYAIQFEITKKQPNVGTYNDTNECLTTNIFRGEDILKEYIGDPNFNQAGDRFSNYEFVRLWAEDGNTESNKLLIDIAASDEKAQITYPVTTNGTTTNQTINADIFSLIYADLTLNDFDVYSVEYSNYDPLVEDDEHNLRLKLDTNHSYNDSSINVLNSFVQEAIPTDTISERTSDNSKPVLGFTKGATLAENKIIWKSKKENGFIDLTKYTGIRLKLDIMGTAEENNLEALKGLGIYLSANEESDAPSIKQDIDTDILIEGIDKLPDLNSSKEEEINKYYGKIIKDEKTINGVTYIGYFRYIKDSNGKYQLEQVHDLKSYALYELPTLKFSENPTAGTENEGSHSTQYIEIEIDTDNINLAHVSEIGLVPLIDEGLFEVVQSCEICVENIVAIEKDYYPIFNPDMNVFFLPFRSDLSGSDNHYSTILQTQKLQNDDKSTPQKRCRIDMHYNRIAGDGEIIAYYPIEKSTMNFKHIGIQLAANCWIPKNALEIHLCSDDKGELSVFSLKIPTLNVIHDPITSTVTQNKDDGFVKFAQIFKKIDKNITIKSISIRATDRFKTYMKQIRKTNGSSEPTEASLNADYVSLYIGKIVLYRAESIPIFHKNIRLKIYNNDKDNNAPSSWVRKVGCILEYR